MYFYHSTIVGGFRGYKLVGIVAKQTIKGSIFSYIGILIGGINVALLFPRIFAEEQIGLINLFVAISSMAAPFASLGINGSTNFFFVWFKDKQKQHHGYFLFMLLVSLIGFLLFTIIYFLFRDTILSTKGEPSQLILSNDFYIIPLTLFIMAYSAMDVYSGVLRDTVLGTIFQEFVLRLITMLLILLYFFKIVTFDSFLFWYVLSVGIPPIAMIFVLQKRGEIFWSLPKSDMIKSYRGKIFFVSLFYVVSGFGSLMVTFIDRYMINYYIGLKSTGIYSITSYFGSIVEVPRKSMGKIAIPLIADSWKNNDRAALQLFYKKSSLMQTMFGLFIFIGIWVNIDSILSILGERYADGEFVIFWIGLSVVFSSIFGVGAQILLNSVKYKTYTYITLALGALVIGTNIIFIPLMGIVGAAFASAIAKLVFSILLIVILKFYFNIQPFTRNLFYAIGTAVVAYYCGYFVPSTPYMIVTIAVKSGVVSVVYFGILYALGVFKEYQPMINQMVLKVWKRD